MDRESMALGLPGVLLSLLFSMTLSILPLPPFNPDWVALTVLFWTLTVPERVGIFRAFVIGLLVDDLTAKTLGQHAIGYALIAALSLRSRASLLVLRLPVQMLWIFGLLLLSEAVVALTEADPMLPTLATAAPALVGALIWPLCARGLRALTLQGPSA